MPLHKMFSMRSDGSGTIGYRNNRSTPPAPAPPTTTVKSSGLSRKMSCVSDLASMRRQSPCAAPPSPFMGVKKSPDVSERKISVVEWLECEALLKSCADYEELNPMPTAINGKRILSQSSIRKSREEDVMDPQHIKKMLEWELSLDADDLRSHAWYHGSIPRSHAERILLHDEEFLVRDCGSKPGSFVLSCRTHGMFFHFVINKVLVQHGTIYERIQYQFEEDSFDSVAGLITYYVGSGKPVSLASGARIKHPRNRLYPLTYFPNQLTNPTISSTAASPKSPFTRSSPSLFASVRGCRSAVSGLSTPLSRYASTRAESSAALLRQQHRQQRQAADGVDGNNYRSVTATSTTAMGQPISCMSPDGRSTPVTPIGNKSETDLLRRSADHCQRQRYSSGSRSLPRSRSRVASSGSSVASDSPVPAGGDAGNSGKGGDMLPGKSSQDLPANQVGAIIVEADGEKVALRKRGSSRANSVRPPPLVVGNDMYPDRNLVNDLEQVLRSDVTHPCSPRAFSHVTTLLNGSASKRTTAVTPIRPPIAAKPTPKISTSNEVEDDDFPDYDVPPPPITATPTTPSIGPSGRLSSASKAASSHTLRWTHRSSGSDSGMNSGDSMTSGESTTSELPMVISGSTASSSPTSVPVLNSRMSNDQQDLILPCQTPPSAFDVDSFQSIHFSAVHDTKPLDKDVWGSVRRTLLERSAKLLATHLTVIDVDLLRIASDGDLGFGITSGIELLTLPDGKQLRSDVLERVNCLSLFVATTILQGEDDRRRSEMVHLWIQVADELRSSMGNLMGFAAVMLGVDSKPVQRLSSTWYKVRQTYTDSAHKFEARLRAVFKAMNDGRTTETSSPSTCIPYILPICSVMDRTPEGLNQEAQGEEPSTAYPTAWDPCAKDKPLAHLMMQIEEGLKFSASVGAYRRNAQRILEDCESSHDVLVSDLFRTEFHLTYLWGSAGATADQNERYFMFRRVLEALSRKCERGDDFP